MKRLELEKAKKEEENKEKEAKKNALRKFRKNIRQTVKVDYRLNSFPPIFSYLFQIGFELLLASRCSRWI